MPVPVDQPVRDDAARERITLAWEWINDFPVNPHPELGRSGPVCPYMGRALHRRHVTLFPFDARDGEDAFADHARALRSRLRQESAAAGADASYLVYFLVPYGPPEPDVRTMMGRVHARLRAEFVAQGVLAGDFWPGHESRGLHSATFRPFASPLSVFPIRNMVPADLPFFAGTDTPAEVRRTYLGYYRRFFGDQLPDYWRRRLAQAERDTHAPSAG